MKRQLSVIAALACLAFLSGCATTEHANNQAAVIQQVDPIRLANIHAATENSGASIPLGSRFTSRIWSWQALSNRELLIYTRPNSAWLLDLGPCPGLFRTPFLGLTAHLGTIDRFSNVFVFRGSFPCRIRQIQPLDVDQLEFAMLHRPGGRIIWSTRDRLDAISSTSGRD